MIILENISKSFGDRKILDKLNLEVKKGDKINIIGPSGCGKSTLLRLMMGLYMPDSGRVIIDGTDITKLTSREIMKMRLKFGMLFQSAALFDSMNVADNVAFTLRENLQLPENEVKRLVLEKMEMVGMAGFEAQMPSNLSGGQRKRVGLARAIAANPEIMLYDEPTTGLDPILSTNIEDLIIHLSETMDVTSITVTHQISTIMRTGDKIYMMYEGKLLEPETPATIENSENDYIRHFINGGRTP